MKYIEMTRDQRLEQYEDMAGVERVCELNRLIATDLERLIVSASSGKEGSAISKYRLAARFRSIKIVGEDLAMVFLYRRDMQRYNVGMPGGDFHAVSGDTSYRIDPEVEIDEALRGWDHWLEYDLDFESDGPSFGEISQELAAHKNITPENKPGFYRIDFTNRQNSGYPSEYFVTIVRNSDIVNKFRQLA